jgi:flagellar protein FlbD
VRPRAAAGARRVDAGGRVIPVTRLDGTPMIVNSDQIAWVEFNPDTVIALTNGEKLIVAESPETIVDLVRQFRRTLVTGPARAGRPTLSLVDTPGAETW